MLRQREQIAERLKLLDVVELTTDATEQGSAPWGGVVKSGRRGTIVDVLPSDYYLVEFDSEQDGAPSILTLPAASLILRSRA
ncbi:MAG TPA: DUF4926 domain-containing protein [Rhizobiaceae bacterium]|jgi:hypothetical protein|nr:DUF4926 domain-containing protein [Rhizobiaceae bacterium]